MGKKKDPKPERIKEFEENGLMPNDWHILSKLILLFEKDGKDNLVKLAERQMEKTWDEKNYKATEVRIADPENVKSYYTRIYKVEKDIESAKKHNQTDHIEELTKKLDGLKLGKRKYLNVKNITFLQHLFLIAKGLLKKESSLDYDEKDEVLSDLLNQVITEDSKYSIETDLYEDELSNNLNNKIKSLISGRRKIKFKGLDKESSRIYEEYSARISATIDELKLLPSNIVTRGHIDLINKIDKLKSERQLICRPITRNKESPSNVKDRIENDLINNIGDYDREDRLTSYIRSLPDSQKERILNMSEAEAREFYQAYQQRQGRSKNKTNRVTYKEALAEIKIIIKKIS